MRLQSSFATDNSRYLSSTTSPPPIPSAIEKLLSQVLQVEPPKPISNASSRSFQPMDAAAPLLGNAPLQPLAQFLAKNGCEKPAATHPTSTVDTIQYFQGIGLREDFYLSLVSWSKKYDRRAVALGPNVYSWGQQDGIDELKLERYAFGYLTCVAYSCHDYLLLCSVESFVAVYCQRRRKIIVSTVLPEAVYCAAWTDEPGTVFAGTDRGTFYCLLITDQEIAVASQVRFHRLRICGLTHCPSTLQLAVGSSDNLCSVWSVARPKHPRLQAVLPHFAAVKAMAFCPWSQSLLATGGGSRDRQIRFWHTHTGTLLSSFATDCQITGLVWSRSRREFAAVFGAGPRGPATTMLAIYRYPELNCTRTSSIRMPLRAVCTAASPDASSVCGAFSDSTIRVFALWDAAEPPLADIADYGSSILNAAEKIWGVDQRGVR